MKINLFKSSGVSLFLIAFLSFTAEGAEKQQKSKKISLESTPAAVQAAIKSHQEDSKLDEIELVTQQDGVQRYRVELNYSNDRDLVLILDDSGKILKTKKEILLNEAPQGVQDTVKTRLSKDVEVDDVYVVTQKDQVSYHVKLDRENRADLVLIFDSEGKLIKEKEARSD